MSLFVSDAAIIGELNGQPIHQYRLGNGDSIELLCVDYGATITSALIKDKHGFIEEVTLCHKRIDDIKDNANPYYGCGVGRYANRIKGGSFSIEGRKYQLEINNGPNHLHGGLVGFNRRLWNSKIIREETWVGIEFNYFSSDGEEFYPGNLNATIIYGLTNKNELIMIYKATTDTTTPINLTNHTYWNLSGNFKDKIYTHSLNLSCDHYLPVDETSIPTGEIAPVKDTPFDFTMSNQQQQQVGLLLKDVIPVINGGGEPGIDHCFVVNTNNNIMDSNSTIGSTCHTTPDLQLQHMATLTHEPSGRRMTVFGSQPGIQVYTGNFLSKDELRAPHTQHNAICLETQHFPDSVNQPHFPSVWLHPGETYFHKSVFVFDIVNDLP